MKRTDSILSGALVAFTIAICLELKGDANPGVIVAMLAGVGAVLSALYIGGRHE